MGYILDDLKRSELLAQHKKERDSRVSDRIKVILLIDDGWSCDKIAKALFISESTVERHLADYSESERLKPGHKGSKPILSPGDSEILMEHLKENVYSKIKDICGYVQQKLGKQMGISAVRSWLVGNGFSYKKPKTIPAKADPEQQKAFVEHYERLMNEAALEGEIVLFGDSVHPSQQTRPSYGWFHKKTALPLETNGGRKRVNLMGSIDLETMDIFYNTYETITGAACVDFLSKLEEKLKKYQKIHLILDRAGYHTCKEVAEYLKTSKIKVHFLPPRSPNLNPIERLWKVMHSYVSNNKYYEKFSDFKTALFDFFDHTVPRIIRELVSCVTDNFHILGTSAK